jgi:hypothetical protein
MTSTPGPPRDPGPAPGSRDPAHDDRPASSAPGAGHQPAQLDAAGLAELLRAPGELTDAQLTALDRLDGGWRPHPDDEAAYDDDPGCDEADLGSPPEWAEPAGDDEDQPRAAEALEAGFTHRYGGTGTGFGAGGPLDDMLPGADLAWHAGQARQRGLDALSDDELIGALGGTRKLCSWAAGLELALVAELDARRAGPGGREGEHVAEEVAAALTLTGRSAALLLDLSRQLERLPQTAGAATCRDLAAALAAHPASRWCLTLTGPGGRAVAHGCARAGPGPPGPAADRAGWLRQIPLTTLETGTCAHRRETTAYRPPPSLRHLIKIRDRRCGYPGCRRPATRCDDDHTLAHHKGGRTCECNLYPLCRRHHRAKQAPGWHLDQPEPGLLTWTLPSGRRYTTTPEPYPD